MQAIIDDCCAREPFCCCTYKLRIRRFVHSGPQLKDGPFPDPRKIYDYGDGTHGPEKRAGCRLREYEAFVVFQKPTVQRVLTKVYASTGGRFKKTFVYHDRIKEMAELEARELKWDIAYANVLAHEVLWLGLAGKWDTSDGDLTDGTLVTNTLEEVKDKFCDGIKDALEE